MVVERQGNRKVEKDREFVKREMGKFGRPHSYICWWLLPLEDFDCS